MACDRARNEGLNCPSIGSILPPGFDLEQASLEEECLGNVRLKLLVQDELAWMVGVPDLGVEERTLEIISEHEFPPKIG
jgi:hypothetical protein